MDILQEIQEEIKQENLLAHWQKYKWAVYMVIAGIIFGTVANVWWNHHQRVQAERQGESFFAANEFLISGELPKAQEAFSQLAQTEESSFAILAQLHEAALHLKQGNKDKAIALYQTIADTDSASSDIRDLAAFYIIFLNSDSMSYEQVSSALAPLVEEGAVWRYIILEFQAFFAIKQGEIDEALALFGDLQEDMLAPTTIKQRATQMLNSATTLNLINQKVQ